jgi:peptidoglycan/xylan/chitin deacetylase (PgdA/CDA1 family)
MRFNKIFYTIKPLIPRPLQIFLRRRMVTYKRKKYGRIWPIDPDTATAPEGWQGWPDNKKFALIISHDVDTQEGHDKCYQLMEIEESLGLRSSFNIVPEKYRVSPSLIENLKNRGFEVCAHGLNHDGKLFFSRKIFNQRAKRINHYLQKWGSKGFTSPSMLCNLDWMHALNITHSTSTFDTDPFEPQQNPVRTIFPFWVQNTYATRRPSENAQFCSRPRKAKVLTTDIHKVFRGLKVEPDEGIDQKGVFSEGLTGYVELPYTMPQDFTLFILMKEQTLHVWKNKLDWIARKGGMALFNSHPDYMNFNEQKNGPEEYPVTYYTEFLEYIKNRYKDQCWHVLPNQMARFWQQNFRQD